MSEIDDMKDEILVNAGILASPLLHEQGPHKYS